MVALEYNFSDQNDMYKNIGQKNLRMYLDAMRNSGNPYVAQYEEMFRHGRNFRDFNPFVYDLPDAVLNQREKDISLGEKKPDNYYLHMALRDKDFSNRYHAWSYFGSIQDNMSWGKYKNLGAQVNDLRDERFKEERAKAFAETPGYTITAGLLDSFGGKVASTIWNAYDIIAGNPLRTESLNDTLKRSMKYASGGSNAVRGIVSFVPDAVTLMPATAKGAVKTVGALSKLFEFTPKAARYAVAGGSFMGYEVANTIAGAWAEGEAPNLAEVIGNGCKGLLLGTAGSAVNAGVTGVLPKATGRAANYAVRAVGDVAEVGTFVSAEMGMSVASGEHPDFQASLLNNGALIISMKVGHAIAGKGFGIRRDISKSAIEKARALGYDTLADEMVRHNSGRFRNVESAGYSAEALKQLQQIQQNMGKHNVNWREYADMLKPMGASMTRPGVNSVEMVEEDGGYRIVNLDINGVEIDRSKNLMPKDKAEKEVVSRQKKIDFKKERANVEAFDNMRDGHIHATAARRVADQINAEMGAQAVNEDGTPNPDYDGITAQDVLSSFSAIGKKHPATRTPEEQRLMDLFLQEFEDIRMSSPDSNMIKETICEQYGVSKEDFDAAWSKEPGKRGKGAVAQACAAFNTAMSRSYANVGGDPIIGKVTLSDGRVIEDSVLTRVEVGEDRKPVNPDQKIYYLDENGNTQVISASEVVAMDLQADLGAQADKIAVENRQRKMEQQQQVIAERLADVQSSVLETHLVELQKQIEGGGDADGRLSVAYNSIAKELDRRYKAEYDGLTQAEKAQRFAESKFPDATPEERADIAQHYTEHPQEFETALHYDPIHNGELKALIDTMELRNPVEWMAKFNEYKGDDKAFREAYKKKFGVEPTEQPYGFEEKRAREKAEEEFDAEAEPVEGEEIAEEETIADGTELPEVEGEEETDVSADTQEQTGRFVIDESKYNEGDVLSKEEIQATADFLNGEIDEREYAHRIGWDDEYLSQFPEEEWKNNVRNVVEYRREYLKVEKPQQQTEPPKQEIKQETPPKQEPPKSEPPKQEEQSKALEESPEPRQGSVNEEKPFHSYTLKSGKKIEWRTQIEENNGVKVTRVVATADGKEVRVPAARFPIPKEYEIDNNSMPESFDGKVEGVKELRESGENAAATIIVSNRDGSIDEYEVRLLKKGETPQPKNEMKPVKPVEEKKDDIDLLLDKMGITEETPRAVMRKNFENNPDYFEQEYENTFGKKPESVKKEEVKEEEKPTSSMPMKEVDGKMKPDFQKAKPEQIVDYLLNEKGYSKEQVKRMIEKEVAKKVASAEEKQKALEEAIAKLEAAEKAQPETELDDFDNMEAYDAEVEKIKADKVAASEAVDKANRELTEALHEKEKWDKTAENLRDRDKKAEEENAPKEEESKEEQKEEKKEEQKEEPKEEESKKDIPQPEEKKPEPPKEEKKPEEENKSKFDKTAVKERVAKFKTDTPEEREAFSKSVPKMSDEELLAYMEADGKGEYAKAEHPEVYDEYDKRHKDEYLDEYNKEMQSLLDAETSLVSAKAMRSEIDSSDPNLATARRASFRAKRDALDNYIEDPAQKAWKKANKYKPKQDYDLDEKAPDESRPKDHGIQEEDKEEWQKIAEKVNDEGIVNHINKVAKKLKMPIRMYYGAKGEDGYTQNGVIYVNRNNDNPEKTIAFVIGHEVTHGLQQKAQRIGSDAYDRYREAACDYKRLAIGDEAYEKLVNDKMETYKNRLARDAFERARLAGATVEEAQYASDRAAATVTREYIEDEIASDVTGEFVQNPDKYMDWFREARNMSQARRILEGIRDWFATHFSTVYKKNSKLAEARDKFNALYNEVIETEIKLNDGTYIEGEKGDNVKRESISAIVEGAGLETRYTDADGATRVLTDKDGNVMFRLGDKEFTVNNPIKAEDIKGTENPLNWMIEDSIAAGKIDQARADQIFSKYAEILNSFLEKGSAKNGGASVLTDTWQYVADTVYRTVASNGDKQYAKSLDITRVCKKNEMVIKEISEIQARTGEGVTPAQILDLYFNTVDAGFQVPCPVCYVFSRYIRSGQYASAAINGMTRYKEHLLNGSDPWTAQRWRKELKDLTAEEKKYEKDYKAADAAVIEIPKKMDDIQWKAMRAKDPAERERLLAEVAELNNQYREAVEKWHKTKLKNWVKSFVLDTKGNLREDAMFPEDFEDFKHHALDLRLTSQTMEKYPGIQRLRKSAGSAGGKEITFASNNDMGEVISGLSISDTNLGKKYDNPYLQAYRAKDPETREKFRKRARTVFNTAARYVAKQNLRGGVRMWSWSDNVERLAPDIAANLMQLELLGGGIQTYSKQLEGIELVAAAGAYVNGSLMARDNGVREVKSSDIEIVDGREVLKNDIKETIDERVRENGRAKTIKRERILAAAGSNVYEHNGKKYVAIFDDKIGIDPHGYIEDGKKSTMGLFDICKNYDRAGNIIVGMNDLHIRTVLADPRIFFCIPWHRSGANNHILMQTFRMMGQDMENFKATDYESMQEDHTYGAEEEIPQEMIDIWEKHNYSDKYACGIEGGIDSTQGKLSEGQKHYRFLRRLIFAGAFKGKKPSYDVYMKTKESIPALEEAVKKATTDKAREEAEGKLMSAQTKIDIYEADLDKAREEIMNDEFLRQTFDYVEKAGGEMTTGDNSFYYPYEYWDKTSTYDGKDGTNPADVNSERYLEYCRRMGTRPKFCGNWRGETPKFDAGYFIDDKGYWKLLIDRRMYDREGNFQDITPVETEGIRPEFLDPEETGKKYHVTQVADDLGIGDVVDRTLEQERTRMGGDVRVTHGYKYGEWATGKRMSLSGRKSRAEEIAEEYAKDGRVRGAESGDRRYSLSTEIEEKYPNWMDNQVIEDENSKKGQRTQVAGTLGTYKKVGGWIEKNLGKNVSVLDASSGMGLGTQELRNNGYNIEDIEPYPSGARMKDNPPTYSGVDAYAKAKADGKKYDYIISNAVLNVIPDDWRNNVLHDMADLLNVGGKMFINTRKTSEVKNVKNKIELESPNEILVGTPENITSYQRFFTPKELKEYVERELGNGYTVEVANMKNSGTNGLAAVVVTKTAGDLSSGIRYSLSPEIQRKQQESTNFKNWFGDWENDPEHASKVVDKDGRPLVVYHGTPKGGFYVFDTKEGKKGRSKQQLDFGSHFTPNEEQASEYQGKNQRNKNRKVYPVYLNLKNPIDVTQDGEHIILSKPLTNDPSYALSAHPELVDVLHNVLTKQELKKYRLSDSYNEVYNLWNMLNDMSPKRAREVIEALGFDGVKYDARYQMGGLVAPGYKNERRDVSYIALRPEQIKSATENNGDFSRSNPDIRYSISYHGSGAEFDKFDHNHMGEGEGAQAYGWGTYVTSVKGIGKTYATESAKKNPTYYWKGQKIDRASINPLSMAYDVVEREGTIKKAISLVDRFLDNPDAHENWAEVKEILKQSKKSDFTIKPARYLYEVDIPDNDGTNYISWDKTLPKAHRRRIAEVVRTLPEELLQRDTHGPNWLRGGVEQLANMIEREQYAGKDIVEKLRDAIGDSKRTSEIFYEAGFVGTEYPSQYMSGGRKDGSKNYVIFNAGDAKIVDRTRFSLSQGEYADKLSELLQRRRNGEDVTDELRQLNEDWKNEARQAAEQFSGTEATEQQNRAVRRAEQEAQRQENKNAKEENRVPVQFPRADLPTTGYENPQTAVGMAQAAQVRAVLRGEGSRETRRTAVRQLTATMRDLHKAMRAQRDYDRATVGEVVDLVKTYGDLGLLDDATAGEVKKLLTAIKDSTAAEDLHDATTRVLDVVLGAQSRNIKETIKTLLSTQAAKIGAKGVVEGKMDILGQTAMKELNDWMGRSLVGCNSRLNELSALRAAAEAKVASASGEAEKARAENELAKVKIRQTAAEMAKNYADRLEATEENIRQIENELEQLKQDYKDKIVKGKEYREQKHLLENLLRENRIDQLQTLWDSVNDVHTAVAEGLERGKMFAERQQEHADEIRHDANKDLEGVSTRTQDRPSALAKVANNVVVKGASASLYTLDTMLRTLGHKAINGEGFLYERFGRGWLECRDNEITGFWANRDAIDAKAKELFGVRKFSDLIAKARGMKKINVRYFDGGEMRDHEFDQAQALYVYMVNKMDDGAMKLRRMGITEEDVNAIKAQLDDRFVKLADWLQGDFLKRKHAEYNEVHERMFGAPMANIENYVPLRIDQRKRSQEVDISKQLGEEKLSSTTGGIIERVHNTSPLDLLNTNAIDLVLDHLQEMNHWQHFAEWNRDVNTLLSDTTFRNKVMNSTTIYGSGKQLWDRLNQVFQLAGGVYRPKGGDFDTAVVRIAQGVSAAKVSFRVFTAAKQLLSLPVFATECDLHLLLKNVGELFSPVKSGKGENSFKWCMENLPSFKERWKGRMAGDTRLESTELDWSFTKKNIVQWASKFGLTPNAFIDACTVAAGAKSVYETKRGRYIKQGYSEAQAEKLAKQDATVAFNQSQQSSEKMFVAPMQVDRTGLAVGASLFRNASMGYERKMVSGVKDTSKFLKGSFSGWKKERASLERLYQERGLTDTQAKRAAWSTVIRHGIKSMLNIAMYSVGAQAAWNIGGKLPYMIFGDNGDEKRKILKEELIHAALGGWLEGLPFGDNVSNGINNYYCGNKWNTFDPALLPLQADIMKIIQKFDKDFAGGEKTVSETWSAITDVIGLGIQSGIGVNPETFTSILASIVDWGWGRNQTKVDFGPAKEALFFALRFVNTPNTQLDQMYIDEIGMTGAEARKFTPEEIAKRYAFYKTHGSTITAWHLYSREQQDKIVAKYEDAFMKKIGAKDETVDDYIAHAESLNSQNARNTQYNKAYKEVQKNGTAADAWKYYQQELEKFKATGIKQHATCATKWHDIYQEMAGLVPPEKEKEKEDQNVMVSVKDLEKEQKVALLFDAEENSKYLGFTKTIARYTGSSDGGESKLVNELRKLGGSISKKQGGWYFTGENANKAEKMYQQHKEEADRCALATFDKKRVDELINAMNDRRNDYMSDDAMRQIMELCDYWENKMLEDQKKKEKK